MRYRELGADDQADFVSWYRAEHPRLLTLLRVIANDRDLAREVVDEAFARALERWSTLGHSEERTRWVRRVAINLVHRQHRQRKREERAYTRHGTSSLATADEYLGEMLDLLAQLSPRARTALALRYVLALSEEETAQVMGVSVGTVAKTLHRARQRLGQLLAADGGDAPTLRSPGRGARDADASDRSERGRAS